MHNPMLPGPKGAPQMTDIVFVLVTIAFFAIAIAYTAGLEKL